MKKFIAILMLAGLILVAAGCLSNGREPKNIDKEGSGTMIEVAYEKCDEFGSDTNGRPTYRVAVTAGGTGPVGTSLEFTTDDPDAKIMLACTYWSVDQALPYACSRGSGQPESGGGTFVITDIPYQVAWDEKPVLVGLILFSSSGDIVESRVVPVRCPT